jgi:hypothetical protein
MPRLQRQLKVNTSSTRFVDDHSGSATAGAHPFTGDSGRAGRVPFRVTALAVRGQYQASGR